MSDKERKFTCCISPNEYAEILFDSDGDMGILLSRDDECLAEVVLTREQAVKLRDHITRQLRKSKEVGK